MDDMGGDDMMGGGMGADPMAADMMMMGEEMGGAGFDQQDLGPQVDLDGKLTIEVVEAKDLVNADADSGVVGDVSDPYCAIFNDFMEATRTQVVQDSLNPVWKESFTLDLLGPTSDVHLQVFDENTSAFVGRSLGVVALDLERLATGKAFDEWLELQKADGDESRVTGQIHLRYQFVPDARDDDTKQKLQQEHQLAQQKKAEEEALRLSKQQEEDRKRREQEAFQRMEKQRLAREEQRRREEEERRAAEESRRQREQEEERRRLEAERRAQQIADDKKRKEEQARLERERAEAERKHAEEQRKREEEAEQRKQEALQQERLKQTFDEEFYLAMYPDVAYRVHYEGAFASGKEHWDKLGHKEGRAPNRDVREELNEEAEEEIAIYKARHKGDCLSSPAILMPGEFLRSANKKYIAMVTNRGELIIQEGARRIWGSNTHMGCAPFILCVQSDGDMVLYQSNQPGVSSARVWHTATSGRGACKLVLQDDRNLVLYSTSGRPIWTANSFIKSDVISVGKGIAAEAQARGHKLYHGAIEGWKSFWK